jgi:hypothetical protein
MGAAQLPSSFTLERLQAWLQRYGALPSARDQTAADSSEEDDSD